MLSSTGERGKGQGQDTSVVVSMAPTCSGLQVVGLKLVVLFGKLIVLFGKLIEPLGSGALMEEVCQWAWLLRFTAWSNFLFISLCFLCVAAM